MNMVKDNDARKAKMFNKYFCFIFRKKLDSVFLSREYEKLLSSSLLNNEKVKQQPLRINVL